MREVGGVPAKPGHTSFLASGAGSDLDDVDRGHGFRFRWRREQDFKLEATVFLAVMLTFAAVLWGDSLREKRLSLFESSVQFLPYFYSDGDEGGASSVQVDPKQMFRWTCDLRAGVQYPYCGYGLELEGAQAGETLDLSGYDKVTLSLLYKGQPTRLKLTLKNYDPAYSAAVTGRTTMPVVAEFPITEGVNTIELRPDQFHVDQWWLDQNPLPPGQPAPDLRNIVAVDLVSGGGVPLGKFTVAIQSVVFSGIILTSAQWYLLILGVWLVLTGIFLVYRFLTVRRGYEKRQRAQARESRELAQARAAAVAASDAKSQFLANMSHELRTPLNAILGYAQLLDREQLSERQRSAVSTIHQSGSHLLTLITDILDLSKIEAGKLDLVEAPFDLHACIAHVGNMIRLRTQEKGLTFAIDLSEDLPRQVVGDAKRIRQILLNLLGNAVKFTTTGAVQLDVSVAAWEDGNVRLRFEVSDTGTGIAEGQIERLFEPFEQAGTAIDRSGGTGLGLSITRQLVRAMGGDVRVQSTLGRGTCFTAEIACAVASAITHERRSDRLPLPQALRVLIVDDDPASCEFLRQAVSDLGASASTVESGESALLACAQQRPDLVFMDLKMPGMNGLAAIRQMKMSTELRDIPVIAISGAVNVGSEADALAAGATRLLHKPIDLETVADCLAQPTAQSSAHENDPGETAFALPPAHSMERLLLLARAGNMRGVRQEAQSLAELDPKLRPFTQRLCELAAAYQSPAVLRLVEQNIDGREAA